jgi:rod shape-determining protein MreC
VIGLRRTLDRHRAISLLAGLALMALLLPGGPLGARARLAGLLRPLALLGGGAGSAPATAGGERALREEADQLRVRVRELEAENAALREYRGLRLEERVRGLRAVPAAVIGRDRLWPLRRSLLLDRGEADGIRRGLPVVAGKSLAGFVVEVGSRTCRVQLLDDPAPRADDPKVRVGALVFRPGAEASHEGALVGERKGILRVRMLPAGAVRPGDLVATSPSDPAVPPSLLIGRVVRVEEDRQLRVAVAEVAPSADVTSLRELIVVILPEPPPRAGGGGR